MYVTMATDKVKLIPDFYTRAFFLVRQYDKRVANPLLILLASQGPGDGLLMHVALYCIIRMRNFSKVFGLKLSYSLIFIFIFA